MSEFKVVLREDGQCEHDTGVCHSFGMSCQEVEDMVCSTHMRQSDPKHQETWHKRR